LDFFDEAELVKFVPTGLQHAIM